MPSTFQSTMHGAYRNSLGVQLQKPEAFVTRISNAIKSIFPGEWAEFQARNRAANQSKPVEASTLAVAAAGDVRGSKKRDQSDEVVVAASSTLKKPRKLDVVWREGSDVVVYSWGDKKEFFSPQWGVTGLHLRCKDRVHGWLHVKFVGPGKVKVWKRGQDEPATAYSYLKVALMSALGEVEDSLRERFMKRIRRIFVNGTRQESLGIYEDDESEKELEDSEAFVKRRRISASSLAPTDFSFEEDVALIQTLQEACIFGSAGASLLVASCKELDFPRAWIHFHIRGATHLHERLRGRDCNALVERFMQLSELLKDEILLVAAKDPTGRLVDFSFLRSQKRKYLD
jgi:hypothetical protein